MAFVVRRATLQDAQTLVRLRMAMRAELDGPRLTPDEQRTLAHLSEEYIRTHLPTETYRAWLAEVDGLAVGTGAVVLFHRPPSLRNPTGAEGYLVGMYTAPDWRRRGVATAVLGAIVADGRAAGLGGLRLRTTDDARSVYLRGGFVPRDDEMQLTL